MSETEQAGAEQQDEPEKIQPFLLGKFALYWTPEGHNVHLRVLVDGFPPFDQEMPFSMVQRFLHVESPADMMAQIAEMSAEHDQDEQQAAA